MYVHVYCLACVVCVVTERGREGGRKGGREGGREGGRKGEVKEVECSE